MDLIDRAALIESMGLENAVKWGNKDGYQQAHSYSTMMLYEIKDSIDCQPTIDAAHVKHGKWELVDEAEPQRYGCSKCSCLSWYGMYNYCPNCGAKMDLEGKHDYQQLLP